MPFTQDDLAKFKGLYIKTGREYLDKMHIDLSSLMTEQTEESLHDMLVSAHSLNGQSTVAGYTQIGTLSSVIEQLFTDRTEVSPPLTEEALKQIQAAVEKMLLSIDEIEKGNQELDLSAEIESLKTL